LTQPSHPKRKHCGRYHHSEWFTSPFLIGGISVKTLISGYAPDHTVPGVFRKRGKIMASFAHVEHPSQHYELLAGVAKAIAASVRRTLQRWAKAHRQAVQDRMFWELALTDPRVMAELRAINDHAEQAARS
jgi:hypothetical protein